ncbi:hypothetical protein BDY21DRAFT_413858, partial [Lineolata rhizophorae]
MVWGFDGKAWWAKGLVGRGERVSLLLLPRSRRRSYDTGVLFFSLSLWPFFFFFPNFVRPDTF